LHAGLLVASDVAISDLIRFLVEQPFLFMLQGRAITGLITAADLGRPAARTYFYLMLSQLEIAVADVVRATFLNQEDAVTLLSTGRKEKHAKLVGALKTQDEFIDDVAALSLMDLLSIIGRVPRLRVHFESERGLRALTRGVAGFRNDVMHPARQFGPATTLGVPKLVAFDEQLRQLISGAASALTRATNATAMAADDFTLQTS
jgi:hypothetical protein